ncbi:MAG: DUF3494 domain-containing protein [Deltaproteobacteria bacterium]|nr:DUF3494 domain-containing protein [Deltaproteobacteria bacterium]
MKISTIRTADNFSRWKHFFGTMLTVALMAPVAAVSQSPASVNLGTAGNFAVIAKTGISTTGVTAITGDLGISPADATYITGFDLISDATNTFSTSSLVTGEIYAADYASPTPTDLTSAISDMENAYTDASGRVLPDYTELYAGNITGQTLTPGLYKWGTGVLVAAGGVVVSGGEDDVWIFQIAGTLTVGNGAIVTLSGGAQAKNIFWQVADKTTLGTTSDFKGIILCQTLIEMQTGATLNGRVLAQTAVTLDANTIIMPTTTAVKENGLVYQKSALFQSYANQTIKFTVPSTGRTTLRILNACGQQAAMLFNGEAEAGKCNQVQFNTTGLANGLYFAKLEVNGRAHVAKIMLLK